MNSFKSGLLSTILLVALTGFISFGHLNAQVPPPPPNGGPNSGHGLGGNQSANPTAPLGNGTLILLVLGAAYSVRKIQSEKKKEQE